MRLDLDYEFKKPELLKQALTHRSVGNKNNERLEFLGDGVLNFIIADELYIAFPNLNEGDLSRLRAMLVKGDTLAEIAQEKDFGPHLLLGSGEMKSGGHRRASILADAVEAILGAVYIDGGFEVCRKLIRSWYSKRISRLPPPEELKDPKTRLQEYLQARQLGLPVYELLRTEGADHEQTFYIECRVEMLGLSEKALGGSRRKAEQAAALALLSQVKSQKS